MRQCLLVSGVHSVHSVLTFYACTQNEKQDYERQAGKKTARSALEC